VTPKFSKNMDLNDISNKLNNNARSYTPMKMDRFDKNSDNLSDIG
jgi:hypothetical protein